MKNMLKVFTVLAALVIVVSMIPITTLADEPVKATIKTEITIEGTPPATPEEYTIRMTAEGDFPMPEGASGKDYDLKVKGAGKASFPAISFDRVGVYTYTVKQIAGKNADATYDKSVYDVKITVFNSDSGKLDVAVAIRKQGSDEKLKEITFTNIYPVDDGTIDLTVKKVWDDNKNSRKLRPKQIKVKLLADGKTIETVTLNEGNEWTETIEDLPVSKNGKRIKYSWDEGTVSRYSLKSRITKDTKDGRTTTLTNKLDNDGPDNPPEYGAPLGFGAYINIGDCIE